MTRIQLQSTIRKTNGYLPVISLKPSESSVSYSWSNHGVFEFHTVFVLSTILDSVFGRKIVVDGLLPSVLVRGLRRSIEGEVGFDLPVRPRVKFRPNVPADADGEVADNDTSSLHFIKQ